MFQGDNSIRSRRVVGPFAFKTVRFVDDVRDVLAVKAMLLSNQRHERARLERLWRLRQVISRQ
jgi:hypothetical protein